MPKNEKIKRKWIRDPPEEIIFGLFLILAIFMYLFRDQLPNGTKLWWAWLYVGTGFLFILDSVIRELNIKNRWSTYGRFVIGIVVTEVGAGFVYGFEELTFIYTFTFIYVPIYTFLFRHRLVRA